MNKAAMTWLRRAARARALATGGVIGLAALVTRWPFRSHWLFSWDSANYALAFLRIDIAAHRPHPPGYLGYVLAAKLLNHFIGDANLSLVLWNMVATALAALTLVAFARGKEDGDGAGDSWSPAVAILLLSPLLWFYGEVAEIYPSELLVSLLIAYTASLVVQGRERPIYGCAMALAAAVAFKASAALLMLPAAAYAWTRVSGPTRMRSFALVVAAVGGVVACFLILQHDLPIILWRHFMGATSASRLIGGVKMDESLRTLNRNIREILTATGESLGPVNALALLAWLAVDRKLPASLDKTLAALWVGPWVLEFVLIHIGKPGYVLPLLPLACLVIGGFYARQRPAVATALVVGQAALNIAYFALVTPPSQAVIGGSASYASKTISQRMASDLAPLTFSTASTIAESDARVQQLLAFVDTTCPARNPIVVVGFVPVDWRRVMWYLPSAYAVHVPGDTPPVIARETDIVPTPPGGVSLSTSCPVIWLADDEGANTVTKPDAPTEIILHLGWTTTPGSILVTASSVVPVAGIR